MKETDKSEEGNTSALRPEDHEARSRDVEHARRAADDILVMSRRATLGGLKIKDLINEGRKEMQPLLDKPEE